MLLRFIIHNQFTQESAQCQGVLHASTACATEGPQTSSTTGRSCVGPRKFRPRWPTTPPQPGYDEMKEMNMHRLAVPAVAAAFLSVCGGGPGTGPGMVLCPTGNAFRRLQTGSLKPDTISAVQIRQPSLPGMNFPGPATWPAPCPVADHGATHPGDIIQRRTIRTDSPKPLIPR